MCHIARQYICLAPLAWQTLSFTGAGMSWWQGVLVVLLGNMITLVPMVLSGHPGTKYGVPFPVLARASFGVRGASLPAMLR